MGDREFNCRNAVQNGGERFFMSMGRYTPSAAVNGDVGWDEPIIEQWSCIVSNWIRMKNMNDGRINKKDYNRAALNKGPSCNQGNSKSLVSLICSRPKIQMLSAKLKDSLKPNCREGLEMR